MKYVRYNLFCSRPPEIDAIFHRNGMLALRFFFSKNSFRDIANLKYNSESASDWRLEFNSGKQITFYLQTIYVFLFTRKIFSRVDQKLAELLSVKLKYSKKIWMLWITLKHFSVKLIETNTWLIFRTINKHNCFKNENKNH